MKLQSFGTYGGEERMAPLFALPAGSGREVKLWDYKQRQPLVIYFVQGTETEFLAELNHRYGAYKAQNIELLVVTALDKNEAERVINELSLQYPLLSDPDYRVHVKYIKITYPQYEPEKMPQKPLAVFVADRYGSIFRYATALEVGQLPSQADLLDAQDFISCLCNP